MSSPPDVWGSKATSTRSPRTDRSTGPCSASNLCFAGTAGEAPLFARDLGARKKRQLPDSSTIVTPLPLAISNVWPSSPNPVTSEHAWTGTLRMTADALSFRAIIDATAARTLAADALCRLIAV